MNAAHELGLRECTNDCRHFKEVLARAMRHFPETAEDIMDIKSKYGIEELDDTLAEIEKSLLETAGVHYEVDNIIKSINESGALLEQYHSEEDENNTSSVGDKFDECLLDLIQGDTRNINSHPLVKEFKEIISSKEDNSQEGINGEMEGDEELAMGQVQRSLTCPITQKLLEDPVKNRSCGHIYSRQAVISHIRARPMGRAKCPVGGCPEKILEADLEEDEDTQRAVRRKLRAHNKH